MTFRGSKDGNYHLKNRKADQHTNRHMDRWSEIHIGGQTNGHKDKERYMDKKLIICTAVGWTDG